MKRLKLLSSLLIANVLVAPFATAVAEADLTAIQQAGPITPPPATSPTPAPGNDTNPPVDNGTGTGNSDNTDTGGGTTNTGTTPGGSGSQGTGSQSTDNKDNKDDKDKKDDKDDKDNKDNKDNKDDKDKKDDKDNKDDKKSDPNDSVNEIVEDPVVQEEHRRQQVEIVTRTPQPSNRPTDFRNVSRVPISLPRTITPVVPGSSVESTPELEEQTKEEEKKQDLLSGPYVAFNANIFLTEQEADEFIKMIEEDEHAKDQIKTHKIKNDNGSVIVTVEYTKKATKDTRPILLYAEIKGKSEEEAQAYAKEHLETMPDLFFAANVFEVDGQFNVVFGIRHYVQTQALKVSEDDKHEITYDADRLTYIYDLEADADGKYHDTIQPAVEAKYKGVFEFSEEKITDNVKRITMKPVKKHEGNNHQESQAGHQESATH